MLSARLADPYSFKCVWGGGKAGERMPDEKLCKGTCDDLLWFKVIGQHFWRVCSVLCHGSYTAGQY